MLTEMDSAVKQEAGSPGWKQWDTLTFYIYWEKKKGGGGRGVSLKQHEMFPVRKQNNYLLIQHLLLYCINK